MQAVLLCVSFSHKIRVYKFTSFVVCRLCKRRQKKCLQKGVLFPNERDRKQLRGALHRLRHTWSEALNRQSSKPFEKYLKLFEIAFTVCNGILSNGPLSACTVSAMNKLEKISLLK